MRSAERSTSPTRVPGVLFGAVRALLLLGLLVAGGTARAQMLQDGPPPQHRLVYRNSLFLRLNPTGFIDEARISYRWRLFRSESPVLRDNFIGVGLAPTLSPAFGRAGLMVEAQPLSVLQLYGIYEWQRYFGGFNYLQSFPSARGEFSDEILSQRGELPEGDRLRNYATGGTQLTLGANLQFKVGPVVARSQFRLVRPDLDLREGDRVFYDIYYDVMAPNRGWLFTNDADIAYMPGRSGLVVGLRWTVTQAMYGDEHYEVGEARENLNGPMHRVGPVLAYTFHNEDGRAFNSPTVLLMANWWLQHRYRTGQQVSAAMPLLAVGMSFNGDLLPVK
ncbi:hypothetical protein P2318_24450 [Myxococcaceae bacterium GXIMD 01537]